MAIIDSLPAVEVSVRLNSSFRSADEYPDPNPYRKERYLGGYERCSRNFIESKEDAEYVVYIDVRDERSIDPWVYGRDGLIFFLFIDGQFMGKRFCQSRDFKQGSWRFAFASRRHPNAERSALLESKFKFQSITTVDDEPTDGDFRRARDLGTIEVKVKLGRDISRDDNHMRYKNLERPFRDPASDYFAIPEEALKGRPLYHGTSFTTPEVHFGQPNRRNIVKTESGPLLATYTFKYRSLEALKIEEVIPRTPSPEPVSHRKSIRFKDSAFPRFEDLDRDQVERLARERHRQLRDERSRTSTSMKRSYGDFCDLTQDEEPPARPYKVIKLRNGHDAIDLTGGY
ncbi:hypothetical protein EsH8_II_000825 [Colletotrichum jinshuiense]